MANLFLINLISRARAEVPRVFFEAQVITPPDLISKISIVLISDCPAFMDNPERPVSQFTFPVSFTPHW
jgi:hypothetical protein